MQKFQCIINCGSIFPKNVLSKNLNYSEFPLINQKPLITLSIGKTRTFEIEKMKDQYGKIAPNIN